MHSNLTSSSCCFLLILLCSWLFPGAENTCTSQANLTLRGLDVIEGWNVFTTGAHGSTSLFQHECFGGWWHRGGLTFRGNFGSWYTEMRWGMEFLEASGKISFPSITCFAQQPSVSNQIDSLLMFQIRLEVTSPVPKEQLFLSPEAERYYFWGQNQPG